MNNETRRVERVSCRYEMILGVPAYLKKAVTRSKKGPCQKSDKDLIFKNPAANQGLLKLLCVIFTVSFIKINLT